MFRSIFTTLALTVICFQATAATRAILIPGRTALLLMEGVSSAGVDPEPRNLYDAIQVTPVQQSGGEAKIIKTVARDFSLVCGTKNSSRESVICNIAIKPGANSTIESMKAVYIMESAESALIYENLAGAGASAPFIFETANHQIKIEATRTRFDFTFQQ